MRSRSADSRKAGSGVKAGSRGSRSIWKLNPSLWGCEPGYQPNTRWGSHNARWGRKKTIARARTCRPISEVVVPPVTGPVGNAVAPAMDTVQKALQPVADTGGGSGSNNAPDASGAVLDVKNALGKIGAQERPRQSTDGEGVHTVHPFNISWRSAG